MKTWFKNPKKDRNVSPSAVVLSIVIHVGIFLLATVLVVFTVVKKEEIQHIPVRPMERPKMKLKKPKVKIKESSRPKSATRIKTQNKEVMPELALPDMDGIGSGLGDGLGDGMGDGFDMLDGLGEISVFGGGQSIGNDFEGTLYNLKYDRDGDLIPMTDDQFRLVIRQFCLGGWKEADLGRYYRSPKKLYATHFMVPPIVSPLGPDSFGDPDMESYWFFVKYKGKLVYPEDIRIRFWGAGDAYLIVRVDGEHVLVDGWSVHLAVFDFWQTFAAGSDQYKIGNRPMKVGDWIELKAGVPLDMEVLFGEWRGGVLSAGLLVEVEGVDYPSSRQGGPLLPAFKTEVLSQDVLDEIMKYLPDEEADLAGGPVFNDYHSSARKAESPVEAESAAAHPGTAIGQEAASVERLTSPRTWNMKTGRAFEAEFLAWIGNRISLRMPGGKVVKIPMERFSEEDRRFIQLASPPDLDLQFTKKTRQRVFPAIHERAEIHLIPRSSFYEFSMRVSQDSMQPYDQELTLEYFVYGEEVTGHNHILLDYQRSSFVLTREGGRTFELPGSTVELFEYTLNGQKRGTKYGGYVAVVTDSYGQVVAHKSTRGAFYENLDQLRDIPVGRYFDRNCIRTTPTRPKPWY